MIAKFLEVDETYHSHEFGRKTVIYCKHAMMRH